MLELTDVVKKLSRKSKWFTLLAADISIVCIAFFCAFSLRFGQIDPFFEFEKFWRMLLSMVVAGSVYAIMLGLPKIKLQVFEIQAIQRIGLCALLLTLTGISLSYLFDFQAPWSIPIIFGILVFFGLVLSRMTAHYLFLRFQNFGKSRSPVVIYGAGAAGIQLVLALRESNDLEPVAFVDDNLSLNKLSIAELQVYPSSDLKSLVVRKKIKRILIAIPSASERRRREIIQQLESLPCEVQTLPFYIELIGERDILDSLHPVFPEKLLGRDKLDVFVPSVSECYKGKSILVSGAGGSIGLELCRQILKFSPSKLVLYERSELALYSVERELRSLAEKKGVELNMVLASVCDAHIVAHTLAKFDVQVVLHAAAYKHVPLVESNELAGLHNNVLGTQIIAKTAADFGVERFVLVSTDKAVRPTNVMGASKRLAELVIQDLNTRSPNTIFSMVRFGNVLGSSGSVIPLFQEQIAKGGPITLTHEDVTRFFMSISEAAQLVLIAGHLATGGDVFVLDMGKSIKIRDLACRMIELCGLEERNAANPNGDIEIITTGLRQGEKLYEELLVTREMLSTPHPQILRAKENYLSELEMAKVLKCLREATATNDVVAARTLIARWVAGYHQPTPANNVHI